MAVSFRLVGRKIASPERARFSFFLKFITEIFYQKFARVILQMSGKCATIDLLKGVRDG
jgi:hypothetical protein